MASSQLTSTSAETIPAAKDNFETANDPDFAIICAFFQKFSTDLGVDMPNFENLHKWLINTDEVSQHLRDLHIKLLRKTRKTVHEKSWESALSKFCFTYSAQDAWEIERFGYKKSSLKVKLRILRELLESQFDRNNKFRSTLLALSADSLRSKPIGRDKFGFTYWLTQDDDCNLRIYQEHLDEDIWRVVATNRDELVILIARLRGNEAVVPSADIGIIDEDTSSSNSCTVLVERPPPPEEQDDSQEEPTLRVPNLRIKLGGGGNKKLIDQEDNAEQVLETSTNVKTVSAKFEKDDQEKRKSSDKQKKEVAKETISQPVNEAIKKMKSESDSSSTHSTSGLKKRINLEEEEKELFPSRDDMSAVKRSRPSLLDSRRACKPSKYLKPAEEESSSIDGEMDDEEAEEEDIDSVAAEEDENEEKEIEEYDEDFDDEVGDDIEDPPLYVRGSGSGKDCDCPNQYEDEQDDTLYLSTMELCDEEIAGEAIHDPVFYVYGSGSGEECLVGDNKNDAPSEPKATFFFGEPGCLKLSPIKLTPSSAQSQLLKPEIVSMKEMENKEDTGENLCTQQSTEKTLKDVEVKNDELKQEKEDTKIEQTEQKANDIKLNNDVNGEKETTAEKELKTENELETKTEANSTHATKNTSDCSNDSKNNIIIDETVKPSEVLPEVEAEKVVETAETSTEIVKDDKVLEEAGDKPKDPVENCNDLKVNKSPEISETVESKIETNNEINLEKKDATKIVSSKDSVTEEVVPNKAVVEEPKCNEPPVETSIEVPKPAMQCLTSNRKRRMPDFTKPTMVKQPASESDFDPTSDQQDESQRESDVIDDIGGKRLKVRPKCLKTDIRKKVEAQLDAHLEETTSSSGEEEARPLKKVVSPKRNSDKGTEAITESTNEANNKNLNPKALTTGTAPKKPQMLPAKQKPTLSEIIEKKLKKTPSKTDIVPACESSPVKSEVISSPPKKSPITKPLKKNLLTQLRETDEDAVPRKISVTEVLSVTANTSSVPVVVPNNKNSVATPSEAVKDLTLESKDVPTAADSVQHESQSADLPTRKSSNKEALEKKTTEKNPTEKVSACNVQESDKDDKSVVKKSKEIEADSASEIALEDVNAVKIKTEDDPLEVQAEEADTLITPKAESTDLSVTPSGGRRSSRRCGGAVVYSELPQPKRTRAGAKITTPPTKEVEKTEKKCETTKAVGKTEKPDKPPKAESVEAQEAKAKGKEKTPPAEPRKSEKAESAKSTLKDKSNTKPAESVVENLEDNIKSSVVEKSSPTGPGRGRGVRKKREVDTTNIIDSTETEAPVRQSRRIAQQKIREEAERRKLEEIALRTMKQELKKKKKAEKEADPTVVEPSEHSSSSSEAEMEPKKKSKKKCPGKDGWSSGSEELEEPEEEDEDVPHYESDPGSPLFKSDHEFSPESDLEDESQVVPMKRARTARKEDAEDEVGDEEACQKCGKSDHPEWILLCDNCDKGYHCSCLSPVLFYIPEGDWYCPPCQQDQLIIALEEQLREYDELVERKRIAKEEQKRLAEEAQREEQARLKEEEEQRRERKKQKLKKRHRSGSSDENGSDDKENNESCGVDEDSESDGGSRKAQVEDESDKSSDVKAARSGHKSSTRKIDAPDKKKRKRGEGRNRRRKAAARGARRRRRLDKGSDSASDSDSRSSSGSGSKSGSSSSSDSYSDSDDEPIYKLRKRRQINVSYRLNEYDDLINSALKKEMDEVAGAGNLGRGKDITTIIEADKEEKARLKQKEERNNIATKEEKLIENEESASMENKSSNKQDESEDDEPLQSKARLKAAAKKKSRKLTTLDISSEGDDGSDEDFKTSSMEDEEEDEDTSITASSESDSLEIYRRKGGRKHQRKAARRAARERRKDKKFVVEDSDDDEVIVKSKKKRKNDSDYTESETDDDDELSELSENIDSADLCDDTSSEDSDGAWQPSKRKKQRKSGGGPSGGNPPKQKKPQVKKPKKLEYSDDDISESEEEEEEDEDDYAAGSGKGSGKQPRSQPLIPVNSNKVSNAGGKGKSSAVSKKKAKKIPSDEELSFSDSGDSTRRTRGRRYAYIEDFDDDSSDGGIKPGVKRPDTPPEEREKFIKKQEEIKRMLAEKNAEGAKLAATPRLTPIKAMGMSSFGDKDKRSPAKSGQDSLSTVPLSVIRQAKVLDIDYLQRKGEPIGELENVGGDVDSEFDDADLPDDLPEDMDEDAIARMVEEEEEFGAAAAARELPAPDEILRNPSKSKTQSSTNAASASKSSTSSSLEPLAEVQTPITTAPPSIPVVSVSGLQEPTRKRLPMPTIHPPLLRHQYTPHPHTPAGNIMLHGVGLPRHPPPTHLLQNALNAPLSQPLSRSFTIQHGSNAALPLPARQLLPATRPFPAEPPPVATPPSRTPVAAVSSDTKPRGRRKKITPLRDPTQKQATVTSIATSSPSAAPTDKPQTSAESLPSVSPRVSTVVTSGSSVIKSSSSSIPSLTHTAQPPQLYKPPTDIAIGGEAQSSVITRMPHLPPSRMMFAGPDVARFYNALPPPAGTGTARPLTPNSPRPHVRGPPLQMPPGLPPASINTPTYGPPHARHAPPHLNPYRPPIYGNPNFGQPRSLPPTAPPNVRIGGPPTAGAEYLVGARPYPPYGYYPPPPPLTTTHHPPAPPPPTSSVIVAAPPSAVSLAAPAVSTPSTLITSSIKTPATTEQVTASTSIKSPPATDTPASNSKPTTESQKKLTTLDVYTPSNAKSPLGIGGGESSGSQPDAAEDSPTTATQSQTKAGEFSGLVSYFSSQHDDYNT